MCKAVIMAGGEGKRLRPITCTLPKPMVPLLNKPVIDYCIELLKKHGVEDITATLHYLPNVIMRHCGDGGKYGAKLVTLSKTRLLAQRAACVRLWAPMRGGP